MSKKIQRNKKNARSGQAPGTAATGPRDIAVMTLGGRMTYGFPNTLITKIRYYDTYTVAITAGNVGKQVMRWNSTFDPDFTNTGHQPLYRDTYAGIYDHYSVISAAAVVKVISVSTTAPLLVGCVTDDDSSASTLPTTLAEQNSGEHTILPPLAGSLSSVTFKPTWDCERVLGISPYTTESYKTAVGANPTEESYLHIWATTLDSSSATLYVGVEMVQTVMWSELTTPTGS